MIVSSALTVHDMLEPWRTSLDVDDAATLARYMEWVEDLARLSLQAARAMDSYDLAGNVFCDLQNELHAAAEAVYPNVLEDS
jgi:hypothetical protein